MVKEKKVEHLEQASVKLTVTIGQEALQSEYQGLLGKYAKSAQIKGFRKGHVPPAILERKFGESIRFETSQKVLEESLKSVFEEIDEKPLPFSQPRLDGELDFSIDKDLTYSVVYDIFPKVEVGEYKGLEIEEPQVTIDKEDMDRELKALQEQNAVVMDKESGAVDAGNIVTVDYWEVEADGNEVPDTRREDFVFTQGSGYNLYRIDDDVLGMNVGDEKQLTKEYPADFEDSDLAGSTRRVTVRLKAIKERQLPAIDDDLAQDISDKYETLDDLTKDVRSRLERTAEARVREQKTESLVRRIVEGSAVPVPESMLQAELERSWHGFVRQFRGANEQQVEALLTAQGQTREAIQAGWRDSATERIRGQLVVDKLIELEGIEVTDEEVDAELEGQAAGGSATKEQLRQYYEQQDMLDYLRRQVTERKLFDRLFEQNTVKKGKALSFVDVMGRNE